MKAKRPQQGKRTEQSPATFGGRLRRLREAAGLTQEELAARADLTAKAVSAIERGERKRPYPHTVRSLAGALGLSDEERASLVEALPQRGGGRGDTPEPALVAKTPVAPLPAPPTALVGRERELAAVGALLAGGTRLLTLTGPGGIGKTRLGLKAAREAAGGFPDGAAFVALAPLADAALVAPTLSQALGLRESGNSLPFEVLRDHLRDKRLLLVLDNFEHVAEAASEMAELVSSCPNLTLLVTSRAPLRVRAEREYPVPPLDLPDPSRTPDAEGVSSSPAGRLFVERARESAPAFRLTRGNAGAVAAICRRLDGLPLALELAAARARFLDPAALLSRLDKALEAGGARDLPERQRTMRATLDWSYGLLSGDEQALFRRLAVFAGGFTLEAAEDVGAAGNGADDVLRLLGCLVEQSLVGVRAGAAGGPDETRYRMLEPVRQYALERLEERDEAPGARDRHAALYLALAEEARPYLRTTRQVEWLERLERENGNLRAALTWTHATNDVEGAARLGWALWVFWWIHNHQQEGRRWMEPVLARREGLTPWLRARAIMAAEAMAYGQGDGEAVERYAEELLRLSRRTGRDAHAEAYAHAGFGLVATIKGDYEAATRHLEKGLPLFLESGEEEGMAAQTHTWLGTVMLLRGDHGRAEERFEEGLALGRRLGDRLATYNALFNLAQLALSRGDNDLAARRYAAGIAPSEEMGDLGNIAYILEGLAAVAAARGQDERSARLLGASEGLIEAIGLRGHTYYRPDSALYERAVAGARFRLGEAAFDEAQERGRAMTPEGAVAEAMREDPARNPAVGPAVGPAGS